MEKQGHGTPSTGFELIDWVPLAFLRECEFSSTVCDRNASSRNRRGGQSRAEFKRIVALCCRL